MNFKGLYYNQLNLRIFMSELITKQTVDAAINGGKSIATVMAGVGNDLINETLNLFILEAALGILKFAAVFVVFFIVKKYISTMIESSTDEKEKQLANAFKTSALVASIIFFTAKSFPHVQDIGKALVAPKVFLLQKANELRK
jgi:hypothetical protein